MLPPNVPAEIAAQGVALLQSARLRDAGFSHGFSTRRGGVSVAPFASLDLAFTTEPTALTENRVRLARALGVLPSQLYQVHQVHGNAVAESGGDALSLQNHQADALIARAGTMHAIAIRVADCVPILVADPASGDVAAIHAGWKGVTLGVVGQAVRQLQGLRPSSHLIAAIGPCIGACCFEVGHDVATQIEAAVGIALVDRRTESKSFIDLRRAVRAQLRAAYVQDAYIDEIDACTYCDAETYYSYRRDGAQSGRQVGAIVARESRA